MTAMRIRVVLVVTAVAVLGAGCSDDGDNPPATTTSVAVTTTVPVSTTGGPTTTAGPAATTTTVPTAAGIVLRVDGLGLVDFGDPKDTALSALSAALGTVDQTGAGCELGGPGTSTARWKELSVEFADGVVRSYNVRPPNGVAPVLNLKTEAGMGLGSTVAQLKTAYGSRLTIPGLSPEFGGENFAVSFPGTDRVLLGSLSDTSDTGVVTGIFTQVCE
jgi:hypothetical protein